MEGSKELESWTTYGSIFTYEAHVDFYVLEKVCQMQTENRMNSIETWGEGVLVRTVPSTTAVGRRRCGVESTERCQEAMFHVSWGCGNAS